MRGPRGGAPGAGSGGLQLGFPCGDTRGEAASLAVAAGAVVAGLARVQGAAGHGSSFSPVSWSTRPVTRPLAVNSGGATTGILARA